MEVIRTERLVLRDFEEADWKSVHGYASDPEVVRYIDWGSNTIEETKGFIQRAIAYQHEQPCRNYDLAVALKSQKLINLSKHGLLGYLIGPFRGSADPG